MSLHPLGSPGNPGDPGQMGTPGFSGPPGRKGDTGQAGQTGNVRVQYVAYLTSSGHFQTHGTSLLSCPIRAKRFITHAHVVPNPSEFA